MKRRAVLIFALAVLIACTTALFVSAESQTTVIPCQRYVNPLYADVATQPLLQSSGSRVTVDSYCYSLDAAAEVLRSGLEARETEITVGYATRNSYNSSWPEMIFEKALEHTGVSTQGDYLRWHYKQCYMGGNQYNMGGVNYITLTYTVDYLSNAWQEQQMDSAVELLLAQLSVNDASDYQKVCAVYDYICQNITYAYDGLNNNDLTVHTAYAALINKSAVCQGYASLFYRLMLELGVDTRVIPGIGAGDNHGWNIVKLFDLYYDVDATWDAGRQDYQYFLKCDANFDDHFRDAEYATETFYSQYPMALVDYDPSQDDPSQDTGNDSVIDSGKCGDNVKYALSSDGVMTISGQGSMWDFRNDADYFDYHVNPWEKWRQDIKTVVFKPGITYVGASAFEGCDKLTHVTFTDSITSIEGFAFLGCTNLENFILPQKLEVLGQQAFDGCTKITKVRIPDTVTFLDSQIFHHCEALTDVYIGGSADAGSYIYANNPLGTCSSLEEIKISPDNIALTVVDGVLYSKDITTLVQYPAGKQDKVYTVPATVEMIMRFSMCDNPYIEGIYLPSSLETIDVNAFSWCENLKEVDFSAAQSVTIIDEDAFTGCSSLTSVTIPASVTSIGGWAFSGCNSLTGIWVDADNANYSSDSRGVLFNKDQTTLIQAPGAIAGSYRIPDSVISIGKTAFSGCTGLQSITIPDSVTSIGEDAFSGCTSLQSIAIPDSVTTIGEHAFEGCSLLKNVTIGNSVIHIGKWAFAGCDSLKSVTIPDSVTTIGEHAFGDCDLLESVAIGSSVTSIGDSAFAYCGRLTDVYYSGTKEQWDAITMGLANDYLTSANLHYESDLARDGWSLENNKWYFYEKGIMVKNAWRKDSKGWVYLGTDGAMLTNAWCTDSKGWCYVGADGYAVTNCWAKDSKGWIWLDKNGSMTKNAWIKDGGKWYFLDEKGYMACNQWRKDSKGWCYLTASGAMATNRWVKDSKGWCYIGADGYCWTNCWAKDSVGWVWLDSEGSMTKNTWVNDGGSWYYLDGNGYMVANRSLRLGGKIYRFNTSGVCTNP